MSRAERRVRPEAAADQHVIAVDRVALLVDRDARRDQPDVADVVLRAGMMAAGEVDVDRRVERDARLAPARRSPRPAPWCARRRSGSRSSRCRRRGRRGSRSPCVREPERRDRGFGERDLVVRHAGDQQVLPDGEADIAVAEIGGDLREPAHLRDRDLADREHDADPVQARPASARARRYARRDRRPGAASRPRPARA